MPKLMKPPTQGKGAETGIYDGPAPTPGLYKGKVVWMGLAKIKTGDNAGNQRLSVLVQITEGKFKGASISTGFNFGSGDGYINQFLHSLTNGSAEAKAKAESAFWDDGYLVDDEKNGVFPIVRIGKKMNPIGAPLTFKTKKRTRSDTEEEVADIDRFVSKRPDGDDSDSDESQGDSGGTPEDDFAEALAAASEEDDSSSDATEDDSTGDDTTSEDAAPVSDDPWSVE